MSRYYSYLNSAKDILQQYKGEEPFSSFLKKYFSQHRKFGSKDRKQVSHLCYCYFRLGKTALDLPLEERILLGLFLCSAEPNELLEQLKPEWNEKVKLSVSEKCLMLNGQCSIFDVFPWKEELSEGIDHVKFSESFFIQPELFLRLRPGKEQYVKQKLKKAGFDFIETQPGCLALPNASKVESVTDLNKDAVVQDHSSQRVGEFMGMCRTGAAGSGLLKVWDCCAASGGKSIMAKDILGKIDLTVSDIRESILHNLEKRFQEAGLKHYKSFVADLSATPSQLIAQAGLKEELLTLFDLIIADVPCSGSGTWSRTPEQLYLFKEDKIDHYVALQKRIVSNAVSLLKPGGCFLYITCSVFRKENEEMVIYIRDNFDLRVLRIEVLKGYDRKADTMFAALLQKPLQV